MFGSLPSSLYHDQCNLSLAAPANTLHCTQLTLTHTSQHLACTHPSSVPLSTADFAAFLPQPRLFTRSFPVLAAGYFCEERAAAALPCPGGTHQDMSLDVMTSEAQCVNCLAGAFCSVGSDEPTQCAAGTYQDEPRQDTCKPCEAGTFQALRGQTGCNNCTGLRPGRPTASGPARSVDRLCTCAGHSAC